MDQLPGVLHAYMYKQLYNTSTKLLVRTTVGWPSTGKTVGLVADNATRRKTVC